MNFRILCNLCCQRCHRLVHEDITQLSHFLANSLALVFPAAACNFTVCAVIGYESRVDLLGPQWLPLHYLLCTQKLLEMRQAYQCQASGKRSRRWAQLQALLTQLLIFDARPKF